MMDEKNFGSYPKKDLYIPTYEQYVMDGIDFLLLKWDDMDKKRQAFVLILSLGAIAFALDQILGFISKWLFPSVSQYLSPNALIRIISISSFIPVSYLLLIFLYTLITIWLVNRLKAKTEAKWDHLCRRLYGQIKKDHSGTRNLVWETNTENKELLFRDELDQLMYDTACVLDDKEKQKR